MEKGKIIRPIIIVVCIYMIVTTASGTLEMLKAGDKVTGREKELLKLKEEQQNLIVRKKQAVSTDRLEQVAYGKLGMAREGEEVIIIPQELLGDSSKPVVVDQTPNWKKWVALFF